MKNTALKALFCLNHVLSILYVSGHVAEITSGVEGAVPLSISSLLLIAVTYISPCNVRENRVVSLFCALLALDSWYILFTAGGRASYSFIFKALSPLILYVSIRFVLLFLFQDSGYKFRKTAAVLLLTSCLATIIGLFVSGSAFALLYTVQFMISWLVFVFLVLMHGKRVAFALKSERKHILTSLVIVVLAFAAYCTVTKNAQNRLSNFGVYLPVLLFFLSVRGIVSKEHNAYPLSVVFNKKEAVLILSLSVLVICLAALLAQRGVAWLYVGINALFAFIYACNIVLGCKLKQGRGVIIKENEYTFALRQLRQEEQLKADFADFLHDDVLQDILSVKNSQGAAPRHSKHALGYA